MQYILRTCNADMTSHNGFIWPKSGYVEAPDWSPEPVRSQGLHGLLSGEGDGGFLDWSPDAKWIVAEIIGKIVDLDRKVKFPAANVIFCGSQEEATAKIAEFCPGKAVVGLSQTAGNDSIQAAGYRSTQTAGYRSIQTAGDDSTQTAGYRSIQTAGYRSIQTAGNDSTQTAGSDSTQTAGNDSTQTAGDDSTQTAGYRSIQTAGNGSKMKAGINSIFIFRLSGSVVIGVVGQNGILPDVFYTCKEGVIVPVEEK